MDYYGGIINFLKLPVKAILLIAIVSGLLLFLPEIFIQNLKLHDFLSEYGKYVGITFVITIGYIIIIVIPKLFILFLNWRKKIKFYNDIEDCLSNLTYIERCFLREFIIQGKEVIEVPIDNTEFISLYNKGVIVIASQNVNRYVFGSYIFIRLNNIVKKKLSAQLLALQSEEPTENEKQNIMSERPRYLSNLDIRDRIMRMR